MAAASSKKKTSKKANNNSKRRKLSKEDVEVTVEESKQKDELMAEKEELAKEEENEKRQNQDNDEEEGESDANSDSDEEVEQEGREKEKKEEDDNDDEKDAENGEDNTTAKTPVVTKFISDGRYRNKQRCLVLCTRGVTARYRHLLEDLRTLIPHHKKESKLDPGHDGIGRAINDIIELHSCNTVLFLECRKRQDYYMWCGRKAGPSVKFHVTNVHTMDELKLTGNCMKYSRPILSFDESFNTITHLKLFKELFIDIFGTPRGHPKSKPFIDRIMAFYYADQRIWVRNYQIVEQQATNALEAHKTKKLLGQAEATSLVEIGPRFVLCPIRVFRGSFGGQTLYQNPNYVSPNVIRAMQKRGKSNSTYEDRKNSQKKRKEREEQIIIPEDPLDSVFR